LTLFEEYAQLLKRSFSDDFQEVSVPAINRWPKAKVLTISQIVSTDDYMPMPVNNLDEYEKVVNVSWYTPDRKREEVK
jgi:hypothetical protein